jgi:hypothetical protein
MEVKQCPVCGKTFENRRWYPKGWGPVRQTCSRKCGKRMSCGDPAIRFWSHVDQSGGPDACWPWTLSQHLGYGTVGWDGRNRKAHRVAFYLANGRWPSEDALHHCDNPSCCNPSHLFEGNQAANMADMKTKGRRKGILAGEQNGRAKLTAEDAREIKRLLAVGMSQQKIADQYGVHQGQVSRIKLGKVWPDV